MSQQQDWRLALGIGSSVLGPVLGAFAAGVPGALIGGAAGTAVGVAIGRNRQDRIITLGTGVAATAVAGIGSALINTAAKQPLDRSVLGSLGQLIGGSGSALPSSGQKYSSSPDNMSGFAGPQASQTGNPQAGYQPPGQQFASPYDPGGSQSLQSQTGTQPYSLGGLSQTLLGSPAGSAAPPAAGQAGTAPGVTSTLLIAALAAVVILRR